MICDNQVILEGKEHIAYPTSFLQELQEHQVRTRYKNLVAAELSRLNLKIIL